MKTIRGVLCLLLFCAAGWAQTPIPGNNVTDLSITFPVFGLNPVPVPGATIAVVGQSGQATWYFWASANYQLGDVISPIGSIQNAPNVLSSSNYVTDLSVAVSGRSRKRRYSCDENSAGADRGVQLRGGDGTHFGWRELPIEFAELLHGHAAESGSI